MFRQEKRSRVTNFTWINWTPSKGNLHRVQHRANIVALNSQQLVRTFIINSFDKTTSNTVLNETFNNIIKIKPALVKMKNTLFNNILCTIFILFDFFNNNIFKYRVNEWMNLYR